ncbi:MAG: c-type cytochrome [Nevskia sp.]|nr:c-type cytochrome [Nevskia sp.]
MRPLTLLAATILSTAVTAPQAASPDPAALAKSRQCFTCHAVDTTGIAPAFKDLAKKYTKDDVGMLARKLQNGGTQHWGDIAMPSARMLGKPLTDEEARALVLWVLRQ